MKVMEKTSPKDRIEDRAEMGLEQMLKGLKKIAAPLLTRRVEAAKEMMIRFNINEAGGASGVFSRGTPGETFACRKMIDTELRDHIALAFEFGENRAKSVPVDGSKDVGGPVKALFIIVP